MNFFPEVSELAKMSPKRIVFPESLNVGILKTAEQTLKTGIGFPILVGDQNQVGSLAKDNNISIEGFEFYDNNSEDFRLKLAGEYAEKYSDLTYKSIVRKAKDPLNAAMILMKTGYGDAVAAGREYTTGEVLISATAIIGLKDGAEGISSLGLAEIPGFNGSQGEYLALADCAITIQPSEMELADIAINSADTVRTMLGWEPRVAMLSFSTCGSAEHKTIDVIREAIRLVKEKRPEIKIDGELQLDSAILPETAKRKVAYSSEVAGKANVLVFPNLHAANIGVKMVQIFGRGLAYGPVIQGFKMPVCDFSRSAPVDEMLGNIAMLVLSTSK